MTETSPSAERAAILEAAKVQFAGLGYERAVLRDIASQAGASVALVKRYFGSRQGLLDSALRAAYAPDCALDWIAPRFRAGWRWPSQVARMRGRP